MAEETSKKYLRKHQIQAYVSDAIDFLLKRRKNDPKCNPFDILSEYFRSVIAGNHVAFREYSYIVMTPYNRACFIKLFSECFESLAEKSMLFAEYHSLLQLLCLDIPSSLLDDIAAVCFADRKARAEVPILFGSFFRAFHVVLYYHPFIRKCRVAYDAVVMVGCKQLHSGHVVVVPTSTTRVSRPTSACAYSPSLPRHSMEKRANQGIEAVVFYKIVSDIVKKMSEDPFEEICPEPSMLGDMEQSSEILSFGDFLRKLVNNDEIQKDLLGNPHWQQSP
jgi:hypothetical protein